MTAFNKKGFKQEIANSLADHAAGRFTNASDTYVRHTRDELYFVIFRRDDRGLHAFQVKVSELI